MRLAYCKCQIVLWVSTHPDDAWHWPDPRYITPDRIRLHIHNPFSHFIRHLAINFVRCNAQHCVHSWHTHIAHPKSKSLFLRSLSLFELSRCVCFVQCKHEKQNIRLNWKANMIKTGQIKQTTFKHKHSKFMRSISILIESDDRRRCNSLCITNYRPILFGFR